MAGIRRSATWIVVVLFIAIPSAGSAQTQYLVTPEKLTRGKMWIKANPNGSLEREQSMAYDWEMAYPGSWDHRNEASGGWDNNAIYHGAQLAGEDVSWMFRNGPYDDADMYSLTNPSTVLVKNYNLVNPNAPEEYLYGTFYSPKYDARGKRHMSYRLEGRVMAWGHPKYDDFVIVRCRLTNTDDVPFTNFYYVRYMTMSGPYRPSSVSSGYDVEYLWDPTLSPEAGFVFYDDTSIPPTGPKPTYTIPPGDSTGNAGDPGNIATQNSRDFKLYSPSVYAYSFVPAYTTPNKNGERKVWRKIVSQSGSAPPEETMPSPFNEMPIYATMVNFVTTTPQPEVSWRDAYAANQANPSNPPYVGAGSLWERNPRYVYAIGPYDIQPNGFIEWVEVLACGAMTRDSTILGGLEVTKQFVQRGLDNLKENWTAARTLIAGNYRFPFGQIPPPTPADAPRLANATELTATPGESYVSGQRIAGVNLTWRAVHVSYADPQTRVQDFAAYKIYRSDISVEGPWDSVAAVSLAEADSLTEGVTLTYFLPATIGVPYRYCVTTVDQAGNESGKAAYTLYPVAAEANPSDELSSILVVPNPFRQVSGYKDQGENKRLTFMNIPQKCTIRIYTLALELLKTIEHDGAGEATWGTQQTKDYMLTDFGQNVMPGVYIYHVESHVPGHEGETSVGKFVIIK